MPRFLRNLWLALRCPLRVVAYDDEGYMARHYALNRQDALEWMSAYQRWASVVTYSRWGRLVAIRHGY